MINSMSYYGMITKVKAMKSRLISNSDYSKIASLEAVSDFIGFLKKHDGYHDLFQKYDEHEIHRGEAQKIFNYCLYQDFTKIYRFANEEQRRYLELIFFRYEVNVLKDCIRLIHNNEKAYDLAQFHPFFEKHSHIDMKALSSSQSIEEYIGHLNGTKYYSILNAVNSRSKATTFDYEMALDIYYFSKAWKMKDKLLTGMNKKTFTHRCGVEIDMLNIMWIYRSKKSYDKSTAKIFTYLIPVNYRLTKSQLAGLVHANSLDDFVNLLSSTSYKNLVSSLQTGTIEREYNKILKRIHHTNMTKYPNSMTTVHNYLFSKELEIDQLTTALECIRYGIDFKRKLDFIIQ